MIVFTDQLHRQVIMDDIPRRIVSIVPSQTELLFDLGLEDEVAGITKFCIHPQSWYDSKQRIGGTKQLDLEKINALKPDLIIGNKEENEWSQVSQLMNLFPVWISDVKILDDALEMISKIGKLVGKEMRSAEIRKNISQQFDSFRKIFYFSSNEKPLTVAYIIWKNPLMTVGADTFIHDMLIRCGFNNFFNNNMRYPEITLNDLSSASPDLILLSSEPYPFNEKHFGEFKAASPTSKIVLVDGEYFSWYGSRLLKAPDYFRSLVKQIHSGN